MTTKELINQYVTAHADNRWMDASELEALLTEFAEKLQKPTSEDLEQASKEWLRPQLDKSYADYGERKMMELTHFDGYAMLDAVEFGAQWQKTQDQQTIELAEEHAMLAGMMQERERMMKDAIEGYVARDKNMGLFLYKEEPVLNRRFGGFWQGERSLCIPRGLFPEQKWDDRPIEVKIIIIKE